MRRDLVLFVELFFVTSGVCFANDFATIVHMRLDGKKEVVSFNDEYLTIEGKTSKFDSKDASKFFAELNQGLPSTQFSDKACLPSNRWILVQKNRRRFFCHESLRAKFLARMSADLMVISRP